MTEWKSVLSLVKQSSLKLGVLEHDRRQEALEVLSQVLDEKSGELIRVNLENLKEQKEKLSFPLYQRLELTEKKIFNLREGISQLMEMADPINRVLWGREIKPSLVLQKFSVPLGVLGIVFESRPDVLPQILALALKSGNAVVFKGGSEALKTNQALMTVVEEVNRRCSWLPKNWAVLLESRDDFSAILKFPEYIDLVIPRGSNQLIQYVMANTQIPVLGHADGVCHLYIHESANIEKSLPIVINSKVQYPSACNALETLLVDEKKFKEGLPILVEALLQEGVQIWGCDQVRKLYPQVLSPESWSHEYGDLGLSIKVVSGLDEAIGHINEFGSHHTDGILAEDGEAVETFLKQVDSSGVYSNASTRFADGYRYGFGAEIGISTSKIHARGPVGLEGLVSYKYKLRGDGHIVS